MQNSPTLLPIIMTVNAPEVEIVATNTSSDEGLEDVTALPFGHDAEEQHSSNQAGSVNKRNKIILIGTGIILLVCAVGYSAAAMSSSNAIAHSFNFNAAPKSSKAKVTKSSKTPKASTQAPTQAPTQASTPAPTQAPAPPAPTQAPAPDCTPQLPAGCSPDVFCAVCACDACPKYVISASPDCLCSCAVTGGCS